MKYHVVGADQSGKRVSLEIEAADAEAAQTIANSYGVLVKLINPLHESEPAEPYAHLSVWARILRVLGGLCVLGALGSVIFNISVVGSPQGLLTVAITCFGWVVAACALAALAAIAETVQDIAARS